MTRSKITSEQLDRAELFMKQAIKLARRAKKRTWPNPMVGALLVKDNQIIASC